MEPIYLEAAQECEFPGDDVEFSLDGKLVLGLIQGHDNGFHITLEQAAALGRWLLEVSGEKRLCS